jgi:hypothetical protein
MRDGKPYLDYRAIKGTAKVEAVLARYGKTLRRLTAAQLVCDCPLPSHDNPKSRGTFKVSEPKNAWMCHHSSCKKLGGGNVIDLVMRLEGVDTYGAARLLSEWFPVNGNPNGKKPEPKPAEGHPRVRQTSRSPGL